MVLVGPRIKRGPQINAFLKIKVIGSNKCIYLLVDRHVADYLFRNIEQTKVESHLCCDEWSTGPVRLKYPKHP